MLNQLFGSMRYFAHSAPVVGEMPALATPFSPLQQRPQTITALLHEPLRLDDPDDLVYAGSLSRRTGGSCALSYELRPFFRSDGRCAEEIRNSLNLVGARTVPVSSGNDGYCSTTV